MSEEEEEEETYSDGTRTVQLLKGAIFAGTVRSAEGKGEGGDGGHGGMSMGRG